MTNYMGQPGFCKTLRFPAFFCENQWFFTVFCEIQCLPNAVNLRKGENQQNEIFDFEFVPLSSPCRLCSTLAGCMELDTPLRWKTPTLRAPRQAVSGPRNWQKVNLFVVPAHLAEARNARSFREFKGLQDMVQIWGTLRSIFRKRFRNSTTKGCCISVMVQCFALVSLTASIFPETITEIICFRFLR